MAPTSRTTLSVASRLLAAFAGEAAARRSHDQLDNACLRLPRTLAWGLEVHSHDDESPLGNSDVIAGLRGSVASLRTLSAWAESVPGASNAWRSFARECFRDEAEAARAFDYIWLEGDGVADRAPAVVVAFPDARGISALDSPWFRALRSLDSAVCASILDTRHAERVRMAGYMPGRPNTTSAAARLYWTLSDTCRPRHLLDVLGTLEGGQGAISVLEWALQEDSRQVSISANIVGDHIAFDGIEIAPRVRDEPEAWRRFLDDIGGTAPPSVAASVSAEGLLACFGRSSDPSDWPDEEGLLQGLCAAAPASASWVYRSRPSHLKLQLDAASAWKVKHYAGAELVRQRSPQTVLGAVDLLSARALPDSRSLGKDEPKSTWSSLHYPRALPLAESYAATIGLIDATRVSPSEGFDALALETAPDELVVFCLSGGGPPDVSVDLEARLNSEGYRRAYCRDVQHTLLSFEWSASRVGDALWEVVFRR